MARIPLFLLLALAIIVPPSGCSSGGRDEKQKLGGEFKDEKQELAYLESLSNPTPVQWKRREELREAKKDWAPDVGSQIALPAYVIAMDVCDSIDALRRAKSLAEADKISSPEWDANDKNRVGSLFAGDKVRILEIGDDYVCVEMLVDKYGEPEKPRDSYPGNPDQTTVYSTKWWEPNHSGAGIIGQPKSIRAKRG